MPSFLKTLIRHFLTAVMAGAVVLPMLFACGLAQRCDTSTKYTQPNFILKDHVLRNIFGVSFKHQCIEQCRSHPNCQSMNFYQEKHNCELNDASHLSNPENLTPSTDGEYINFHERPPAKCSKKLCSTPHPCIINQKDGNLYRCCRQDEMVLNFPRKSVQDYVVAENLIATKLTAFTISMWSKMDSTAGAVDFFSYGIPDGSFNEVLIELTDKSVWVSVGNSGAEHGLSQNYQDNTWHHFCYTWRSDLKKYYFYIDGSLKVEGSNPGISEVKGGGAVVLGQDQDSYKGGFQQNQSFKGSLSKLNMWDKYMNASECAALYHACSVGEEGNLIKWSDLYKKPLYGNLELICSDSCT